MSNYYQTNRQYKCVLTNEFYTLFRHKTKHSWLLRKTKENATFDYPLGTEVNGFEIRAYDILYKFKDKSTLLVNKGCFLPINIDNPYTHYKRIGLDKRFIRA